MSKLITLSNGMHALVDDWWFEKLNQYKWDALKSGKAFYAKRRGNGKNIFMARVIANTPDKMQVDHINHDTLDNREENLRNATRSQNKMNGNVRSNNKLGKKNIHIHHGSFRVEIYKDGKREFRKIFHSLDEAVCERNEALKEIHGDFACEGG